MAVTVTDNRTILYEDGLTNITGASTNDTSFFAEATGSAAEAYNIATGQIYWSGATPNFTTTGNELIYVWSAVVATQNGFKEPTPSDSSHAQYLSDGTNNLIIYQAGNDKDAFKHAEGQVSFQCFLVDIDYLSTINTNGDLAAIGGSFGAFNAASTTMDVGAHYTTLSKALGGGSNCFMDIIRYGGTTAGISISGGTTGDRGNFLQAAIEDRSSANNKAHGIIREYTGGAYGVQGTLHIGNIGTGTSYFQQNGFSLTYEDRLVADDKYRLIFEGNATGTNVIVLTNATISSARPAVLCDFTSSNIDELTLTSVTFLNLVNTVSFPTDTVTNTLTHNITNCTFNNCGQIDPGTVTFTGNTITNTTAPTTGALLLDGDGTSEWSDISLISGGTGHGIYITVPGTYGFSQISYSGYGANDTTDAAVYNNSGGAVTINITGGDTPTVRNGAGASTTVNNSNAVTIRAVDVSGSPIIGARVYLEFNAGGVIFNGSDGTSLTDINGEASTTVNGSGAITGRVRKSSSSPYYKTGVITGTISGDFSANIVMILDE